MYTLIEAMLKNGGGLYLHVKKLYNRLKNIENSLANVQQSSYKTIKI
jgi:hypothetical protein